MRFTQNERICFTFSNYETEANHKNGSLRTCVRCEIRNRQSKFSELHAI